MLITHTEIYRFSIPMKPFVIATGTMDFAQNVLIRICTDDGLYGVGECSAFPVIVGETQETCLAMARDFAALWKNQDALDIEARLQQLHSFTAGNGTIKSAFDMALYDLSAKAQGLPLYRFLGGAKRAVETDITIGIATPETMAQQAATYKNRGAGILKIKLGQSAAEDIERVQMIRQAVGPGIVLRIDANQGWDFDEAVTALNGMVVHAIQFCEQPMRTWNDWRLPELRSMTPIKIMADESCYDHYDAQRLIRTASCDYLNIKLAKSGGIHEALAIYQTAEAAGMACMIGGMLESRIALSANLHVAYACANLKFYDMDTCMIGHLADPCTGGVTFTGFNPDIGDAPGIGADADESFLQHCQKWVV